MVKVEVPEGLWIYGKDGLKNYKKKKKDDTKKEMEIGKMYKALRNHLMTRFHSRYTENIIPGYVKRRIPDYKLEDFCRKEAVAYKLPEHEYDKCIEFLLKRKFTSFYAGIKYYMTTIANNNVEGYDEA